MMYRVMNSLLISIIIVVLLVLIGQEPFPVGRLKPLGVTA